MHGQTARTLDFLPHIEQPGRVWTQPALFGRDRELERLRELLEGARNGVGRLVCLAGEAGIGKSRLAEELAREAEGTEVMVIRGCCWEAGGAPAFWPWRQALTGLSRALDTEPWARNQLLARFMAGKDQLDSQADQSRDDAPLSGLDPEQARFLLMEAVNSTLTDAARDTPLLLILEDMHAADRASVSLLEFIEPHLRHSKVLLLATYRPSDVDRQASPLQRTAQRAEQIALGPLSSDAVREYITTQVSSAVSVETLTEVSRATEGNPLFLEEVSRLLNRQPNAPRAAMLTQNVHNIITQRLSVFAEQDTHLLEVASIVGRDFRLADVVHLADCDETSLEQSLERMVQRTVLERAGLQEYRFSHILVREALYHRLSAEQRRALHIRRGRRLQELCEGGSSSLWSEVAHHYLSAQSMDQAIFALEKAAKLALSQLAFDDAVSLTERALSSLAEDVDPLRRVELLLLKAHAQLNSGAVAAGRAVCYEAARIAVLQNNAQLLARSALECGGVYVFAKVDKRLVALLEQALRALPETDVALRAEVSARLAAALQPANPPEPQFVLARSAIALARTQDDEQLLLRVLRSSISALMDLGPAEERLALNREYAALAKKLNLASHLWRARCRLVFDHFELGQLDEAYDNLAHVVALAEQLDHPDYLWRAMGLRAMSATFRGRFPEALRLIKKTEIFGKQARDPNWQRAEVMLRLAWHRAQGLRLPAETIETTFQLYEGEEFGHFSVWSEWARHGEVDQVRGALDPAMVAVALTLEDRCILHELGNVALGLKERELLQQAYEAILPHATVFVSGGMTAMTWEPPLNRTLGLLALELGQVDEGLQRLGSALKAVQKAGSQCYAVWLQLDLAGALLEHHPEAVSRISQLLEEATPLARALGMTIALDKAEQIRSRFRGEEPVPPSSRALPAMLTNRRPTLTEDSEFWCLRCGGETIRLANTKGVRLLAKLLEHPEQEFHVLDLEGVSGTVDGGNAGSALDDDARRQYKRRVEDLRSELEEAEQFSDSARASALTAELQAVTAELSRAFGIGGRKRPVASAVERARVNVQRRLKDAIKRIRACSPESAKELERSVRTGTYCVYEP